MMKKRFQRVSTLLLCLSASLSAAGELPDSWVQQGKTLTQACMACHDFSEQATAKIGPPLWGVLGRPLAAAEGFKYSDALKKHASEIQWTIDELDQFLSNPMNYRGEQTAMAYPGIEDKQQRLAIIAYLGSLGGDEKQRATLGELLTTQEPAEAAKQDFQGMPEGKGRETTFYACNACHSMAIVQQQSLSRSSWEETLEWMVEEQGMDELEEKDYQQVLDYLVEHFGTDTAPDKP